MSKVSLAASREQLRRAAEDGERLYRRRMHSPNGPSIAEDNRINGILTLDLPDALGAFDRAVQERYDEGWEHAQDAIWNGAVCSECGCNHDADESAMCEGGEVETFREWVERRRG